MVYISMVDEKNAVEMYAQLIRTGAQSDGAWACPPRNKRRCTVNDNDVQQHSIPRSAWL